MLTRKHYIKMAEIVNKIEDIGSKTRAYVAFVEWIREDGNPNFDRDRFHKACGMDIGDTIPYANDPNVDAVFREPDAEEMRIHNAEVAAASDP